MGSKLITSIYCLPGLRVLKAFKMLNLQLITQLPAQQRQHVRLQLHHLRTVVGDHQLLRQSLANRDFTEVYRLSNLIRQYWSTSRLLFTETVLNSK
jgi:hypothetical protein